jgi:hypothetical protein
MGPKSGLESLKNECLSHALPGMVPRFLGAPAHSQFTVPKHYSGSLTFIKSRLFPNVCYQRRTSKVRQGSEYLRPELK